MGMCTQRMRATFMGAEETVIGADTDSVEDSKYLVRETYIAVNLIFTVRGTPAF